MILKVGVLLQFENGAIFVASPLTNCYVASVNPEFGTTLS